MTVHTVTLEDQGVEQVAVGTMCSMLMTTGSRKGGGKGRASFTVHGKAVRLPCPMKATKVIDGKPYCAIHGPTSFRPDPYYETIAWKKLRRQALERDNHVCRYCGNHAVQADHIVARSKGGTDSLENLAACCPVCNKIAASHVFRSFAEKKKFVLKGRKALGLS